MVETPRVLLPIGCVGSNTRSYHTKKIDYGRFSSYSDQQRTLGRPLSPHLTIYKQPITAISSISNRISGIALGTGIAAASTLAIVATNGDIRPYIFRAQDSVPYFAPVAKFLVALPLTYHWLAGARQMVMHLYGVVRAVLG